MFVDSIVSFEVTSTKEYSVSGVSPPVMMTFTVPTDLPGRVIITPVCGFFTFLPLVMILNTMPSLTPWLLPPAMSVASLSQERK